MPTTESKRPRSRWRFILLLIIFLIASILILKIPSPQPTRSSTPQAHPPPHPPSPTRRDRANDKAESDRLIWTRLEKDQETFAKNFSGWVSKPGKARLFFYGVPSIQFWIKTIASDDPAKVEKAIEVFELSAEIDPSQYFDDRGDIRMVMSYLEREGFTIHSSMRTGLQAMAEIRNNLNYAFEHADVTTADTEKTGELMNNFAYAGDSDDRLVLEDALPILKVFVPRLNSSDPEVARKARSVINIFTYSLFPDRDIPWWEDNLHDLTIGK